jgi:cytochrome c-type biogenesis protein CcmH
VSARAPLRMSTAGILAALALAVVSATGVVVLTPAASLATATPAATSRVSLPTIERRVMCVTCKIPLIVAESPQAGRERAYIRGLIDEGLNEPQIERALVGQYGPAVLGLPAAHGFDLAAYLVPLAAVLSLAMTLALLLPRWRRRARAQTAPSAPPLTAAEAARLDADLARFDR